VTTEWHAFSDGLEHDLPVYWAQAASYVDSLTRAVELRASTACSTSDAASALSPSVPRVAEVWWWAACPVSEKTHPFPGTHRRAVGAAIEGLEIRPGVPSVAGTVHRAGGDIVHDSCSRMNRSTSLHRIQTRNPRRGSSCEV
jgi:hypothetical protein